MADVSEAFRNMITDVPIPDINDSDLVDPDCDPRCPKSVTKEEVIAALHLIRDGVIRTPCNKSSLSRSFKMDLYLKMDFQQVTGSFKERGARNFLLNLSEHEARHGVVASSAGNHAQALAYHGEDLGIPVTVVMPTTASLMKIENCIARKANVILKGASMTESKPYAMKIAKINGLPYVNGYDHPLILAGQGTVGVEILDQVPKVDAIVVPVGGGGLIAGVAAAVKSMRPEVLVIGAESTQCTAFAESLKKRVVTYSPTNPTIADGLAVSWVGCNSLKTCIGLVDKMVSVDESYIHRAIVRLLEAEKCVVEGAGATALAAIMSGQLTELEGKTVVPILSGGNIDTTVLARVIERGLALEGRICRFKVIISDRPGSISDLCTLLKEHGVSVREIFHERAWLVSNIFSVDVKVVCETRDNDHALELRKALDSKYGNVQWGPKETENLHLKRD